MTMENDVVKVLIRYGKEKVAYQHRSIIKPSETPLMAKKWHCRKVGTQGW